MLTDISSSGEPTIKLISDAYRLDRNPATITDLWGLALRKWDYQCEYLEKWRELETKLGKEVDAIISPVSATAAIRHEHTRYYGYLGIYNLLDLPSVVVPVTFADKNIDLIRDNYQPLNTDDATVQAECKCKTIWFLIAESDWKYETTLTTLTSFSFVQMTPRRTMAHQLPFKLLGDGSVKSVPSRLLRRLHTFYTDLLDLRAKFLFGFGKPMLHHTHTVHVHITHIFKVIFLILVKAPDSDIFKNHDALTVNTRKFNHIMHIFTKGIKHQPSKKNYLSPSSNRRNLSNKQKQN